MKQEKQMEKLKWKRLFYVGIMVFSVFFAGFFFALKDLTWMPISLLGLFTGIMVDKINNKLITN